MSSLPTLRGVLAAVIAAATITACGSTSSGHHTAARPSRTPATMTPAFRAAARSECAAAGKIAGQVNAATIISDLLQGAPRWQAELHAADTINSPAVPDGHNVVRIVAVKLAEAALAISVANQAATSVPMKVGQVRRSMGQVTSALDDATGDCANAGY